MMCDAMNHVRSGKWLQCMIVPTAVTEVCRRYPAHSDVGRPRASAQPFPPPQAGQMKPSGKRRWARCRAEASSSGKRTSNSWRDIGRSDGQRASINNNADAHDLWHPGHLHVGTPNQRGKPFHKVTDNLSPSLFIGPCFSFQTCAQLLRTSRCHMASRSNVGEAVEQGQAFDFRARLSLNHSEVIEYVRIFLARALIGVAQKR